MRIAAANHTMELSEEDRFTENAAHLIAQSEFEDLYITIPDKFNVMIKAFFEWKYPSVEFGINKNKDGTYSLRDIEMDMVINLTEAYKEYEESGRDFLRVAEGYCTMYEHKVANLIEPVDLDDVIITA